MRKIKFCFTSLQRIPIRRAISLVPLRHLEYYITHIVFQVERMGNRKLERNYRSIDPTFDSDDQLMK